MTRRWQHIISWSLFVLLVAVSGTATLVLAQAPETPLLTKRTGVSLGLLGLVAAALIAIIAVMWDTRVRAIQAIPETKALNTFVAKDAYEKATERAREQNATEHTEIKVALSHLSDQVASLAERR